MRTKKMMYTSVKSSRSTPAREDLDEMVWIFFLLFVICILRNGNRPTTSLSANWLIYSEIVPVVSRPTTANPANRIAQRYAPLRTDARGRVRAVRVQVELCA